MDVKETNREKVFKELEAAFKTLIKNSKMVEYGSKSKAKGFEKVEIIKFLYKGYECKIELK